MMSSSQLHLSSQHIKVDTLYEVSSRERERRLRRNNVEGFGGKQRAIGMGQEMGDSGMREGNMRTIQSPGCSKDKEQLQALKAHILAGKEGGHTEIVSWRQFTCETHELSLQKQ